MKYNPIYLDGKIFSIIVFTLPVKWCFCGRPPPHHPHCKEFVSWLDLRYLILVEIFSRMGWDFDLYGEKKAMGPLQPVRRFLKMSLNLISFLKLTVPFFNITWAMKDQDCANRLFSPSPHQTCACCGTWVEDLEQLLVLSDPSPIIDYTCHSLTKGSHPLRKVQFF